MWMNEIYAPLFGQILKVLRDGKNLSQEELAHQSGLDRTYISLLERGKKNPTIKTLWDICDVLNVSPGYVFEKLNKALGNDTNELLNEKQNFTLSTDSRRLEVPVFETSVSCGSGESFNYSVEDRITLEELIVKNPDNTFIVKSAGHSMYPLIMEGDMLVIDKAAKVEQQAIVLVQVNDQYTVKRIQRKGKEIRLVSENPSFPDIIPGELEMVSICGVVTHIIRSLKD